MDFQKKGEEWIQKNPLIEFHQEELEKIIQWKFRLIKYSVPTTDYKIRDVDFFIDKKRRRIYYRINKKKIVVRILKKKTGNRWKSFGIEDVEFFYRWRYQKNQRPILFLYL